MPIDTPHPEYSKHSDEWRSIRDAVQGEAALRRDIVRYLPVPPGLHVSMSVLEGGKRTSSDRYSFYARMAEFPEIVSPTLNGLLGMVHEKDPEISLPPDMEYLIHRATPDGEDIYELWERCTRELLVTGRFIALGDIRDDKAYLCEYVTESMINWQLQPKRLGGEPSMIVLRECRLVPSEEDPFTYDEQELFRLLSLDASGTYTVELWKVDGGESVPVPPDPSSDDLSVSPVYFGKAMDFIPITVVNALEVGYDYGPIPMLPMTRRALSIFRRSADYNRSLYIKGDPQCVLFGVDENDVPTEIGGGTIWAFTNPDGSARYLDIDGQGIPLMRQAINDEFTRFADEVGMLLEGSSTGYESGEALRRRQALRQVTIKSVIINAAEGMERALRSLGRMMGKTEEECRAITFRPNIDFTEPTMTGQELLNLVHAKRLGAPISQESMHDLMRRRQLTELTYAEELVQLAKEDPLPGTEPEPPVPAPRAAAPTKPI